MNTKIKIEKGTDEAHAFLELLLDGVQRWLQEARSAMEINCEEAMPSALELMRENSKVVERMVNRAKEAWKECEAYEAVVAVVEVDARERGAMLKALEEGVRSRLGAVVEAARGRRFAEAANGMQDLGEAMAAASRVFRGMERAEGEGGEA